ncbi:MAG TPA: cupredoxin domain-containing protein [Baekduia sp.]|nr:cupredoxin domain-containing protein [Baekduia sp.]
MLAYDIPPAVAHVARAATAIGIGEREFAIAIYRPRVRPGALKFNVRNLGEDVHDLVIRRAGRRVGSLTSVVTPGATATLRLTLRRPGRYQLVCTVADHEARGMRATLRVSG